MVKLRVASSCSSRHEVVVANLRRRPFLDLYFVFFSCFLFVQTGPNLCRLPGSIVQFISLSQEM